MKMTSKAREINKGVKGYDRLTLNVTPTWEDEDLTGFNVSFYCCDEEFENFKHFKPIHTDANELANLLFELRDLHDDKYEVNIFAYYHGCREISNFYNDVIDELDCYNRFHMEYEWG